MRAFEQYPSALTALAAGAFSFNRAVAKARLVAAGVGGATIERSATADIVGVQRLAAQRRHVNRRDEQESFRDRYLTLQPSLDES